MPGQGAVGEAEGGRFVDDVHDSTWGDNVDGTPVHRHKDIGSFGDGLGSNLGPRSLVADPLDEPELGPIECSGASHDPLDSIPVVPGVDGARARGAYRLVRERLSGRSLKEGFEDGRIGTTDPDQCGLARVAWATMKGNDPRREIAGLVPVTCSKIARISSTVGATPTTVRSAKRT